MPLDHHPPAKPFLWSSQEKEGRDFQHLAPRGKERMTAVSPDTASWNWKAVSACLPFWRQTATCHAPRCERLKNANAALSHPWQPSPHAPQPNSSEAMSPSGTRTSHRKAPHEMSLHNALAPQVTGTAEEALPSPTADRNARCIRHGIKTQNHLASCQAQAAAFSGVFLLMATPYRH